MLKVVALASLLLIPPGLAAAQEASPEKSATQPWPVDPRCAVMAAHLYNQGAVTAACLPAEAARPYLNQAPGQIRTQEEQSITRTPPPPVRPRPVQD